MLIYLFNNSVDILEHFDIGEMHHCESKSFQVLIPCLIFPEPFICIMLPTVYFQDEIFSWATKVNNVIRDILLPIELATVYLFPPYLRPEKQLGISHIASQVAGKLPEFLVEGQHLESPSIPL